MSSTTQWTLRLITFGTAESMWGAVWDGPQALLLVGREDRGAEFADIAIERHDNGTGDGDGGGRDWAEVWRLSGPGFSLASAPLGEAAAIPDLGGFDQLCRVHGEATIDGVSQPVDELGRRCTRAALSPGRFESIRDFAAWFEPATSDAASGARPQDAAGETDPSGAPHPEGAALTALRPIGARGHESDLVGAALLVGGNATAVAEPRLSTAYAGDGNPARAGLELWIARQDDAEDVYPRRVAGQAAGPRFIVSTHDWTLEAQPFHCVSHGQAGNGVYLLARSR